MTKRIYKMLQLKERYKKIREQSSIETAPLNRLAYAA
jgi:hypothetical protein